METFISKKRYAYSFFIIIILIFSYIILNKFYFIITGNVIGQKASNEYVSVDYSKIYPFEENEDNNEFDIGKRDALFDKYEKLMYSLGNISESLTYDMYGKAEISRIGYLINSVLTNPNMGKFPVRLENGYFAGIVDDVSTDKIDESAKRYAEFSDYVDSKGIKFLYIQPLLKLSKYASELPYGVYEPSNSDSDELLSKLEEYGVETIDLREKLNDENEDYYSFFFRTDHHWNSKAGLWAAYTIANYCNDKFGSELSTKELESGAFIIDSFENAMYGSTGNAIPKFIAKSENFDILVPTFDTNFSLCIPDRQINTTGKFSEIFFDYDELRKLSEEGGGYAYETILEGNRPLVQIRNNRSSNNYKVLIIKDSFGSMVAPYFSLTCSELNLIDIRRSNGNFNGSIKKYIEETKPDLVIAMPSFPSDDKLK